jgi:pyruvate kinase
VANAVLDGTDCVMLSGETAAGDYPLVTLTTMIKIVLEAENMMCDSPDRFKKRKYKSTHPITDNISEAAVHIATKMKATALVVPTRSGFTPRMVAKYRPATPVFAMVSHKRSKRLMCIVWGVETVEIVEPDNIDTMIERATEACRKAGYVHEGDTIVITAGVPIGVSGKTNLLKVQIV